MDINPENIMSELNAFRKANKYCDVILIVGKSVFHAHRSVLAAATEYFDIMFGNDFQEKRENKIELKDIDEDGFELFMEYIYAGKISLNLDVVKNVLSISLYLQTNCLAEKCANYIKENFKVNNCLEYLMFAELIGCHLLKTYTRPFIRKHFSILVHTDYFLDITFPVLNEVIRHNTLCNSKTFLLRIIMKWVNHDRTNRTLYVNDLMKFIEVRNFEYMFTLSMNFGLMTIFDDSSVDVELQILKKKRTRRNRSWSF